MDSILLHSIALATLIGFLLILLQYPIYHLTQLLIHPDINLLLVLKQYYYIRIWGAPAVLVNFVLVGALIAIQKPRELLILLTVTNILAIVVSIVLVFIFDLNIIGIAIADVVAQYIGLVFGFLILSKHYQLSSNLREFCLQISQLIKLLHTNLDLFIRTLGIIVVFSFFTIWSSHIGTLVLAANTLLMNFFQLMANALGGFDNVAEMLAGEAVGKNN